MTVKYHPTKSDHTIFSPTLVGVIVVQTQRMHHLVAIREALQIRSIFGVRLGHSDAPQRKKFYSQNLCLLNRLH